MLWMQTFWGATPGFLFFVFLFLSFEKLCIKCFSAEAIIYLVVGNTPYGKRHISRNEPVLLQDYHNRFKLAVTSIFFVQMPDQFDALLNPKNAKEITPPSIGQLEKRTRYEFSRHQCCLALNFDINGNHLCYHRLKPLAESCVPWEHELRNVVIQLRGCRITKCRNSSTVCKHNKECFRVVVVVQWDWVECKLQSNMLRLQQHRCGSGDMPFSVRHLSYH